MDSIDDNLQSNPDAEDGVEEKGESDLLKENENVLRSDRTDDSEARLAK